jgi:hypothetical protein
MCAVTKPALAFNKQTEKMSLLEEKCFGHRKGKYHFVRRPTGSKPRRFPVSNGSDFRNQINWILDKGLARPKHPRSLIERPERALNFRSHVFCWFACLLVLKIVFNTK